MSALIGAAVYLLTTVFGPGATGPIVVSVAIVALVAAAVARRLAHGPPITAEA